MFYNLLYTKKDKHFRAKFTSLLFIFHAWMALVLKVYCMELIKQEHMRAWPIEHALWYYNGIWNYYKFCYNMLILSY